MRQFGRTPQEVAANPVRDAVARLGERLGIETPQPRCDAATSLGPPSHPVADLRRLALIWNCAAPDDVARDAEAVGGTPGPATMTMIANRLGLDLVCEQRDPTRLGPADLPCVVMLAGGGSRLLLSRRDDEFVLAGAAGEFAASVADVAAEASGTIFRARPLPEPAAEPRSDAAEEAAAPNRETLAGTLSGFLIYALQQRRRLIVPLVVASVVINLFGLALPVFSMAVFDRVIPHSATETLWALALGVLIAFGIEFALRGARLKLFDAVGQGTSFDLQSRVMSRLLFARLSDLPRNAGALVQPVQELEALSHLAPQLVVGLLVDLPFFLLLMVFLASIAGPVVIAPLVGTAALVGVHVAAHWAAHSGVSAHAGYLRRQIQSLVESVATQERIRVTGASDQLLRLWERNADEGGHAAHKARYWHGIAAQAGAVIVQATIVVAIIIGVYRIDAAAMTVGALSASYMIVFRAMSPVSQLTGLLFRMIMGLQTAAPAAFLLAAEIDAGGERRALPASAIAGQVELRQTSFAYPGEARHSLQGVSLAVRPGEKVGLVGRAGCGKSTLLSLIARLREPGDGRISIDGRDARQFDPIELRRAISYMPQDAQLVDGSVEDNLRLGLASLSTAEMERIARLCGVHDFVSQHPSGYSLKVGPGGQRLSGGERQCVALARALMGSPRLLLLDEPTAAMDNGQEARIVAELKRHLGPETGLIVATHRLPLLSLVDRVVVLEGGRVVADGPREDVFRKFGLAA